MVLGFIFIAILVIFFEYITLVTAVIFTIYMYFGVFLQYNLAVTVGLSLLCFEECEDGVHFLENNAACSS